MKAITIRAAMLSAASMTAFQALAQEAPAAGALQGPQIENTGSGEIVVSGTRASLENAERVKRNSSVIVDGISADDISALPDASIADSLVRVTGLTANDNPRGPDAISIRGLGPDLTLVTVNGRILPSPDGGDRRISLAELPTEGIAGAYVLKTSEAASLEGAVAGTVDLQTIHPLDSTRHGLTLVARALTQDNATDLRAARHYAPVGARAEATYVNRFGSNLGVALSYAFLKQYTGFVGDQIDSWRLGTGARADVNGDGVPDALPTNVGVTSNFNDDTRHSVLGMVQWNPSPDIRLTVDGMYIRDLLYTGPTRFFANNIYNGANLGAATSATANDQNSVETFTGTTALYREIQNLTRQLDQTYGGGINLVVDKGPILAKFDASWEEARRDVDSPQAVVENDAATATAQRQAFGYDISDPDNIKLTFNPLTADDYALSQYQDTDNHIRDTIKAVRADFAYRPDHSTFLKSFAWGAKVDRHVHDTSVANTLYSFASLAGRPDLDASYLQLASNPFAKDASAFGGSSAVNFPYFDIGKLAALRSAPGVIVADQFANDVAGSFRVQEDTAAMYGQFNVESGPLSGNVGLRYVITDMHVTGGNGTTPTNLTQVEAHNSYHYLLPAMNVRYEITHGLIGRLAYGKTFSRQQFNDLAISSAVDLTTVPTGVLTINRGNPNLKPFTSNSVDASLEWYPNKATSIAIAGYAKFIKNFLVPLNESTTVTLNDGTVVPAVITTTVNDARTSHIYGVEVTARRDLTFLPGLLKNLGIQVNWTHNWTNINQSLVSLVGTTAPTTSDQFTKDVVNAQLYYSTRTLDLRVAYRNFDRYARLFFNSYQIQPGGQLDLSAGWTFYKNFRVIGSVTNATGQRMRRYVPDYRDLANTSLTQLSVYQGRVVTMGLRTTF